MLLLVAASMLLRPWEQGLGVPGTGPRGARAFVTRAVDGDTIEARIDGRLEDVRYIGVDTPETVKPGTPVQCYGPRASRFDHSLVEHRRGGPPLWAPGPRRPPAPPRPFLPRRPSPTPRAG